MHPTPLTLLFLTLIASLSLYGPGLAQPAGLGDASLLPENQNLFAREFITDYQAWDVARVAKWIHPRRGLLDNRKLQTKAQFQQSFPIIAGAMKTAGVQYAFSEGYFIGSNYYHARYIHTKGKLGDFRDSINMRVAFEQIDGKWYLVESFTENRRSDTWNMLGETIADEQLTGPTLTGRSFSVNYATGKEWAVVLSFFDPTRDFFSDDSIRQVQEVQKWYREFQGKPVYIMSVSEYPKAEIETYFKLNKFNFPVVFDLESVWHRVLQIELHPSLLLIDHNGVLRAAHREGADPEVYALFRTIVSDVVAQTPGSTKSTKTGGKAVDPSQKF